MVEAGATDSEVSALVAVSVSEQEVNVTARGVRELKQGQTMLTSQAWIPNFHYQNYCFLIHVGVKDAVEKESVDENET